MQNNDELNPEHPVTQTLNSQWHKILALVMRKLDVCEVSLSPDDLSALINSTSGYTLIADEHDNLLTIRLMPYGDAVEYARTKGVDLDKS